MAGSEASNTGIGVSLFCPACTSVVNDPRILPCLHSLCKTCIEKRLNGAFSCPVCQEKTTELKTVADVENLPTDSLLGSVLDMVALHGKKRLNCDVCDEQGGSPAVSRCKECAQYLCALHGQAHKQAKNSKLHCIVNLEELRKKSLKDLRRPLVCAKHDQELLVLFCETCDVPVCRECTLGEHRSHSYVNVNDAIHKCNSEIEQLLQTAKEFVNSIDVAIPKVQTKAAEVNLKAKKILSEIDLIFDFQVTTFWTRKKELRDRVQEIRKSRIAVLKTQEEGLKTTLKQLRHACKFTEVNLQSSINHKDGTSLVLRHLLTSRLKSLTEKEAKHLEPLEESNLQLLCDDTKLREAMENFGRLDCSYAYPPECTARGVGIRAGSVTEPAKFVVVLKDRDGRPLGRSSEVVNVEMKTGNGMKLPTDRVLNMHNGTYHVTYTPVEEGLLTIVVKVRGREIKGSPFCVKIVSDLQKSWI